jgi:kynureninase
MDFPSMIHLFRAQQASGFELHVVPAEDDLSVRTERMLEAIDRTTSVVAFSHVLFRTSYLMDAAAIIARAHEAGAIAILDTYQSAGIVPLDVSALQVDFAVGGCLKWLCGGPGNAFLYTRPDLLPTLRPAFTGWLSHRAPFAFETGEAEMHTDARRLMNGTPSIPAYYAALAGLDIVTDVGVERIRARSQQLTARLLELADKYGFASAASRDPERLAGTVAVSVPEAARVSRILKARDFLVDYRPPVGIRISPHFYNTMRTRTTTRQDRLSRRSPDHGIAGPERHVCRAARIPIGYAEMANSSATIGRVLGRRPNQARRPITARIPAKSPSLTMS